VNPEDCAVCAKPMGDEELESYSLTRWDAATRTNSLVQMFCPDHRPVPAPEWLKREVTR
jgi:hypothetical protein